jgi:hypothetical protein
MLVADSSECFAWSRWDEFVAVKPSGGKSCHAK